MNPILNPANIASPLSPLNPMHHHRDSNTVDTVAKAVADTVNNGCIYIEPKYIYLLGGIVVGAMVVLIIWGVVALCKAERNR